MLLLLLLLLLLLVVLAIADLNKGWKIAEDWPSGDSRCRWVCFFFGTDLKKFSIALLVHHWIICSEWVPSEWESKQLKKHDDNPQLIHTIPVHQLTSCEVKICMFVRNKIIKWWTGVVWIADYCDVFISCLDSHSDGTHSLHRIHWWASDVMLHFSKSTLMKKQAHLHLGRPEGD